MSRLKARHAMPQRFGRNAPENRADALRVANGGVLGYGLGARLVSTWVSL